MLRELWPPREVMTDDILIGYVASDRVCPRSVGIMLGVTIPMQNNVVCQGHEHCGYSELGRGELLSRLC
jgi:hypothetical protein